MPEDLQGKIEGLMRSVLGLRAKHAKLVSLAEAHMGLEGEELEGSNAEINSFIGDMKQWIPAFVRHVEVNGTLFVIHQGGSKDWSLDALNDYILGMETAVNVVLPEIPPIHQYKAY